MRLTCPACLAEFSLDVALGRDEDARAVAQLLQRHLQPPLGHALVRYVALFRPAKRRLQMTRMVSLLEELLPDIERGAIARKGRDWPAPLPLWQAALDQVQAARDKGTLTLPLTSHGYLYEILCALSDKAEASAEREAEAQLRGRTHTAGPVAVAASLPVAAHQAAPQPDPLQNPERRAEVLARLAATNQRLARAAAERPASPQE